MTTDTAAAMLRGALVPTLVVGIVAVAAAGFTAGPTGIRGAVAGAVLVIVFFALGLVVLGRTTGLDPAVTLLVALSLYVVKVAVIGAAFFGIDASGALDGVVDRMALALTAIACTLTWTTAEIVAAVRVREPLYRLDQVGGR
ncbi:MAG TPA: hypothetical protein VGP51_10125 [Nocardioidaceae bacterium]|jgi:ATP synthase protein I|nr:hypothetical protein [Actinomycetota bacterium]MDQ3421945.1 hypothetical protein [Actinomycetota bacterium]HEV8056829.1 hypothetical protein [Nocardioidaceae bacterium]